VIARFGMSALGQKRTSSLISGTRFAVESRTFHRLGVDVVMPKAEEIDQIHNTYMDVFYERSTPAQIDGLPQVACTFIARDRCCRRSGAAGRAISVSA